MPEPITSKGIPPSSISSTPKASSDSRVTRINSEAKAKDSITLQAKFIEGAIIALKVFVFLASLALVTVGVASFVAIFPLPQALAITAIAVGTLALMILGYLQFHKQSITQPAKPPIATITPQSVAAPSVAVQPLNPVVSSALGTIRHLSREKCDANVLQGKNLLTFKIACLDWTKTFKETLEDSYEELVSQLMLCKDALIDYRSLGENAECEAYQELLQILNQIEEKLLEYSRNQPELRSSFIQARNFFMRQTERNLAAVKLIDDEVVDTQLRSFDTVYTKVNDKYRLIALLEQYMKEKDLVNLETTINICKQQRDIASTSKTNAILDSRQAKVNHKLTKTLFNAMQEFRKLKKPESFGQAMKPPKERAAEMQSLIEGAFSTGTIEEIQSNIKAFEILLEQNNFSYEQDGNGILIRDQYIAMLGDFENVLAGLLGSGQLASNSEGLLRDALVNLNNSGEAQQEQAMQEVDQILQEYRDLLASFVNTYIELRGVAAVFNTRLQELQRLQLQEEWSVYDDIVSDLKICESLAALDIVYSKEHEVYLRFTQHYSNEEFGTYLKVKHDSAVAVAAGELQLIYQLLHATDAQRKTLLEEAQGFLPLLQGKSMKSLNPGTFEHLVSDIEFIVKQEEADKDLSARIQAEVAKLSTSDVAIKQALNKLPELLHDQYQAAYDATVTINWKILKGPYDEKVARIDRFVWVENKMEKEEGYELIKKYISDLTSTKTEAEWATVKNSAFKEIAAVRQKLHDLTEELMSEHKKYLRVKFSIELDESQEKLAGMQWANR